MSDTPRTNDIQYGIEKRSHLRGFVVPDDVFDMMELARQLERELAAKAEECEGLRNVIVLAATERDGSVQDNIHSRHGSMINVAKIISPALREAK